MLYRDQKLKEILSIRKWATLVQDYIYDDIFSGSEVLEMAQQFKITPHDTTVSFSLDGAQLYQIRDLTPGSPSGLSMTTVPPRATRKNIFYPL